VRILTYRSMSQDFLSVCFILKTDSHQISQRTFKTSVTASYIEETHISSQDEITFIYTAFRARGTRDVDSRDSGTLGSRIVAAMCLIMNSLQTS